MTIDKAALLAKVKASGEDQTKIEEFKDSGPALVEGLHNARFVAYIEVGKHSAMYQGKPKKTPDDLVYLGFEFSGPKVVPAPPKSRSSPLPPCKRSRPSPPSSTSSKAPPAR